MTPLAAAVVLGIVLSPTHDIQARDTAGLSALMDSMCVRHELPGASAAVVLPDGTEWSAACGIAAAGVGATADHKFETGSITKTYTAALVLALVAEGLLALEDPIAARLPDIDGLEGVTVRHLLQHTSGLFDFTSHPGYIGAMRSDFGRRWSPRELLATFPGEASFAPGARWAYSSTNYHLLGMLIEVVTGEPLHEALRKRVLEPHGLGETYFGAAESVEGPAAHAFLDIDGDGEPEDLTALVPSTSFLTAAWASGAIQATARDVARWMHLLGGAQAVREPLFSEMLTGRDRGDGMQHGLGVILTTRSGQRLIGHKGNSAGFSASAWSAPDANVSVAVLTNRHATDVTTIATALLDAAVGSAAARQDPGPAPGK